MLRGRKCSVAPFVIAHFKIVLHFIAEPVGHIDNTDTFRGLGRTDDLFPFDNLVSLCDGNGLIYKIKIIVGECEEFTLTDSRPVENFETIVEERLFHNGICKEQVFAKCPELHLFGVAKADTAGFQHRVFAKIIILVCKVHNGAHLAVDGAEISLGVRLSCPGIPISEQLVLPLDNVLRTDIGYLKLSEIRKDLCIDNVVLTGGSTDTNPRIAILAIDFHELPEGHVQTACNMQLILVLVIDSFAFSGKAPFGGKLRFAFPVLIAEFGIPCVSLFIFVSGHLSPPYAVLNPLTLCSK